MVEERVTYLINGDIDGVLDAEERAELSANLESSAEARKLHAELRRLSMLMGSLPEQEPPVGLASRIIEQVRLPSPKLRSAAKASGFSLSGLLASFQPVQSGLAFAAGLLVTVSIYEVANHSESSADLSSMVGTMVADPAASPGSMVDTVSIAHPGLSGSVAVGKLGDFTVLNFHLESRQQTEIVVGMAEAGFRFGGVVQTSAAAHAGNESYEVKGGSLHVMQGGKQEFAVFLRRNETGDSGTRPIGVEVRQMGKSVFSRYLRTGGTGS